MHRLNNSTYVHMQGKLEICDICYDKYSTCVEDKVFYFSNPSPISSTKWCGSKVYFPPPAKYIITPTQLVRRKANAK